MPLHDTYYLNPWLIAWLNSLFFFSKKYRKYKEHVKKESYSFVSSANQTRWRLHTHFSIVISWLKCSTKISIISIIMTIRLASHLSSFLGSHESVLVMFSSLSSSPGNADSSGDLGMTCGAGRAGIQGHALSPSSPSTFHFHQHVLTKCFIAKRIVFDTITINAINCWEKMASIYSSWPLSEDVFVAGQ